MESEASPEDARRDFGIVARFNARNGECLGGDQFLAAFGLDPRLLIGSDLTPAERDRVRRDTWNHIADVVDPTCHLVGTTMQDWSDGSRTYYHELSCGHTCETTWPEAPAFCSYCGARVTDDDE